MRMRPIMASPRQRQADEELGAAADLAGDVHGPGVRLDDLLRDRHAEAGALLLGGEEGIEDAVELLGRDAAPVVADTHHGVVAAVLDEELVATVVRAAVEGADGVVGHVRDDLLPLPRAGQTGRPGSEFTAGA